MRTTTDAANWRFYFTVSDLARFLGKSPVTVRGWEQKISAFKLPRDSGGDRKLTTNDVRKAARLAHEMKRIPLYRLHIVEAAVTILELVEKANEDSSNRSTRQQKK